MESFSLKLSRLLKIYNIPLEENWTDIMPDKYTVYKYWLNLGLINNDEFQTLFPHKEITVNNRIVRFFKNFDYHFNPRFYHNGLVADVGSGFGFITFWLLLSDAKYVYTIGDPLRIGFIQKLYERAVELKLVDAEKISFKPSFIKVGDVSLSENIKNDTLALVLLHDTLEHITPRIFPWLVKSSYNNLKPGGMFISLSHNSDSPAVQKSLQLVWDESEKNVFINQRLKIIKEKIKDISEPDAQKLAKHTRGLDSIDFFNALEKYKNEKIFPNHNLNVPPIDVQLDIPEEGDTGIERITSEFLKNNFKSVKVYPEMMGSRRSRYLQFISRMFPDLFLKHHIFDQGTVFVVIK